jgi:superfamily II helicase
MRPLCKCGQRPRAINYKKEGKIYYRKLCDICAREGIFSEFLDGRRAGYKIKNQCEKCGFKSPYLEVFRVFHLDGNLEQLPAQQS